MNRFCPVCGTPCAPGERFCKRCGTRLPESAPDTPAFSQTSQNSAFAPAPAIVSDPQPAGPAQAGAAASTFVPASQQASAAQAGSAYQAFMNDPQQSAPNQWSYGEPAYAAPVYEAPAFGEAPKKKKTGLIVGLCAGAVLLIAAAVILYFFVLTPNALILSADSMVAACGESFTLTAEVRPGSAVLSTDVIWTSSDESIALVDGEGSVTALRPGACTVTATTGNGKTASCAVTVAVEPYALYLSESYLALERSESFRLEAELYPEDALAAITWTSSDESVARVDPDGTVTASGSGTCTVTASTSNGARATCSVTVGTQPSSLYLSNSFVDLSVGDTYTLTPEVYPENAVNYTVSWSSSNASVATVSDGRITAVGKGSCTITAATSNGISSTCAVNVSEKAVAVESVTLSSSKVALDVGDKATLTVTVSPRNATDQSIVWSSSKTSVATVSDGVVTAVGAGTCEITAAASNGKRATCAVTVTAAAKPASSSQISIGDIVLLGSYEQDNNSYNGWEDIEWLVLDKQGSNVLVISRYALDCQLFNGSMTNATWDNSSVRSWLNDTFYYDAFTPSERNRILSTTVTADKNPSFSTYAGSTTYDRIFLLSISEASWYFGSDDARLCKGTAYCYAQGAYVGNEGNCWWWLRTPGNRNGSAANVGSAGGIHYDGNDADSAAGAVRPAMWITIG